MCVVKNQSLHGSVWHSHISVVVTTAGTRHGLFLKRSKFFESLQHSAQTWEQTRSSIPAADISNMNGKFNQLILLVRPLPVAAVCSEWICKCSGTEITVFWLNCRYQYGFSEHVVRTLKQLAAAVNKCDRPLSERFASVWWQTTSSPDAVSYEMWPPGIRNDEWDDGMIAAHCTNACFHLCVVLWWRSWRLCDCSCRGPCLCL